MPEKGKIGLLCITDKQFESMEIYYSKKTKPNPNIGVQLELF